MTKVIYMLHCFTRLFFLYHLHLTVCDAYGVFLFLSLSLSALSVFIIERRLAKTENEHQVRAHRSLSCLCSSCLLLFTPTTEPNQFEFPLTDCRISISSVIASDSSVFLPRHPDGPSNHHHHHQNRAEQPDLNCSCSLDRVGSLE